MKILTIEELILINQYAQGVVSRDKIKDWYLALQEIEKQSVVKSIWVLATQAQVKEDDIPVAAEAAGLKQTHTPVVMISKGDMSLNNRGYKLSALSGTVLNQAFWFVLECFALAERRRREKEGPDECNHWWHKDLSDDRVVKEILEGKY
ncbi:MAG: DUF5958 family protein [Desulfitobacteriaceae bacterium]|nr:DUF5958 family protein [Desulfitobacteriaceae bacterium]